MTPMFAQLETVPGETIKNFALIVLAILGGLYYAKEIFFPRKPETTPQPLNVALVKALHDQFADKAVFDALVKHNTERHGQLFNAINKVEREARESTDRKFEALNEERRETLQKLDDKFSFIRESIVEIKTELKIRNE